MYFNKSEKEVKHDSWRRIASAAAICCFEVSKLPTGWFKNGDFAFKSLSIHYGGSERHAIHNRYDRQTSIILAVFFPVYPGMSFREGDSAKTLVKII